MSPFVTTCWARFKQNKGSFIAFKMLLGVVLLCLLAPFVANDKPLVLHYKGDFYAPVLFDYTETTFGGELETLANYKDPFVQDKIHEGNGWMLWPLIPYSYDTVNNDRTAPAPPSEENWLGTDDQGRDLLARLIYGIRLSLSFGAIVTLAAALIGLLAGSIQGYYGGLVDLSFQRLVEIWSGLPTLFILLILSSVFEPNFLILVIFMVTFKWLMIVPAVRAEFLRQRQMDYVKAAQALGVRPFSIMWRHILPNAMVAGVTYIPFLMTSSIALLASLDFLGFGLPPGSPSLGEILMQGKRNLSAPWIGITGFISTAFLLSLLIFIGEGIRDAFDPRKALAS